MTETCANKPCVKAVRTDIESAFCSDRCYGEYYGENWSCNCGNDGRHFYGCQNADPKALRREIAKAIVTARQIVVLIGEGETLLAAKVANDLQIRLKSDFA